MDCFPVHSFLVTGTPVYSRKKIFEFFGKFREILLKSYGDSMQTCLKFWQPWLFSSQISTARGLITHTWMSHSTHMLSHGTHWKRVCCRMCSRFCLPPCLIHFTHMIASRHTHDESWNTLNEVLLQNAFSFLPPTISDLFHTYECIPARTWWLMEHIEWGFVAECVLVSGSRHGWVMSHVWTCDMTEWCHTYTGSCDTYDWVMGRLIVQTWLIYMCDMIHFHVWRDLFTCVTWLISMCDMTHLHVWHDSFPYVAWLIYMCDMTHLHVWHDSFTCATWLIYMCDMTHLHVWHDSFTCGAWLIQIVTWL